jgi:hypothetical protein
MALALAKPPAKDLAAIAARSAAKYGQPPTQAAVLKTYANNQAGAAKPTALSAPPAITKAAVAERAQAKTGKAPTQKAVNATYAKDVARVKARPPKPPAKLAAPKGEIGGTLPSTDQTTYPGPGGPQDPAGASAYWNDFLTRLKAGETPAQIQESNAAKLGGTVFPGQGPEQNLSGKAYAAQVLQQYQGSPTLGNIDVSKSYDPKAWLAWLKKVGPAGYVGVNSGKRDDAEYARLLEAAKANVASTKG